MHSARAKGSLARVEAPPSGAPDASPATTPEAPDVQVADPAEASTDASHYDLVRRLVPHAAVIGVLLVISLAAWAHVWITGSPTSTVLCQCGDPGQAVWFMAWVPYAISHGHNPLFTTAMLANQGGANLLQSTSYLLPSFVLAPVTWLFGPTAAFNVAVLLAPVLSGWCMWLALGRLSRRWGARAAGAVLWGFSPFMFSHEIYGHLSLTVLFFPPLLFALLYDLLADDGRDPRVIGLLIGLLTTAQFFTGTETLAITTITTLIALVAAATLAPKAGWRRRRRIGTAALTAALVAGVLLGYPVWWLLAGTQHVIGQAWPGSAVAGAGLGGIVHVGARAHSGSFFAQIGGYFGAIGPNTAFLGSGLLILIAVSAVVWARRRVASVLVVTAGVAWLLSLGTILLPLGPNSTPWWLLWKHLDRLPLLASILPQRFALAIAACAAGLLTLSIDGWLEAANRVAEGRSPRSVVAVAAGVALALAVGVTVAAVPIAEAYSWPLVVNPGSTPVWFLTSARQLPPGTEVLTYPYASSSVPDAMFWQAQDGLRFRLAGGRALIPGADGRHSQHLSPFGGLDARLAAASYGSGVPVIPGPDEVAAIRAELVAWKVQVVVVVPFGRSPGWAAAVFTEALGRLPRFEHGAFAWYGLGQAAPLRLKPAEVAPCVGSGAPGPAFDRTPTCVMELAGQR
jgi:hypothetical protein